MTDTSNPTPKAGTRQEVPIGSGPMQDQPVKFDHVKRELLRIDYDTAVRCNDKSFWFDGQELLTPYAGYLLEYLDTQLGAQHGR